MSDKTDFQLYSSGRALHKGSLGLRVTPASLHVLHGPTHLVNGKLSIPTCPDEYCAVPSCLNCYSHPYHRSH